jgi:hypothetical protein
LGLFHINGMFGLLSLFFAYNVSVDFFLQSPSASAYIQPLAEVNTSRHSIRPKTLMVEASGKITAAGRRTHKHLAPLSTDISALRCSIPLIPPPQGVVPPLLLSPNSGVDS